MTSKDTLRAHFSLDRLFPHAPDSSELLVSVAAHDYSASAIARAVEDCDAHLINLNILADTPSDTPEQRLVALRVDHRNGSAVARSLERYGLRVITVTDSGDDADATFTDPQQASVQRRIDELIKILEI